MSHIQKLNSHVSPSYYLWLDVLRIFLGAFILIKGFIFAADTESLNLIIKNSKFNFLAAGLVHYVIFAHITGGFLILLGLLTRVAVSFQVPILLGAIIFVNSEKGFFSTSSELGISIAVFVLLIIFLIYGSGKLSVDHYMQSHEKKH